MLFGIEFGKAERRLQLGSCLLKHRGKTFAWPTPGRPAIDNNRHIGAIKYATCIGLSQLKGLPRKKRHFALAAIRLIIQPCLGNSILRQTVSTNNIDRIHLAIPTSINKMDHLKNYMMSV